MSRGALGISEVERGDHADLLEELEVVELVPVLRELAVLGPPDVDGTHLDRVPRRRHTVEGTSVSASVGEPPDNAISGHHQVVHCRFDVWKRSEEARPEGAVGFTSVFHERVVVDVVDSHEAIDGIGIVVVQPLQVTRSKRASIGLAVSHGDSPFGFLEIRPPTSAGLSDGCCVTPQLLLVRASRIEALWDLFSVRTPSADGHLSTASAASAVMARSSSREPSHMTVNLVIVPSWLSSSASAPTATGWRPARHSYPPPWPAPATCRTDARA